MWDEQLCGPAPSRRISWNIMQCNVILFGKETPRFSWPPLQQMLATYRANRRMPLQESTFFWVMMMWGFETSTGLAARHNRSCRRFHPPLGLVTLVVGFWCRWKYRQRNFCDLNISKHGSHEVLLQDFCIGVSCFGVWCSSPLHLPDHVASPFWYLRPFWHLLTRSQAVPEPLLVAWLPRRRLNRARKNWNCFATWTIDSMNNEVSSTCYELDCVSQHLEVCSKGSRTYGALQILVNNIKSTT